MISLMRSVRFNIGLIVALAVLFALGTVIPQQADAPQEVEKFLANHQVWAPVFTKLGFFHLYHTPLVIGLMALLGLDIFVCRIWPQLKEVRSRKLEVGRKKWGSLATHIGLVLVFTGALIKAIWGFEEFVMILPGQDKPLARYPQATLSLFDFKVDFYSGTRTPKIFESDLQFSLPNSAKPKTWRKKIQVNDPLSAPFLPIAPLRFYQASWGATGMFKKATLAVAGELLDLKMGQERRVGKTPFFVTAKMMLPDFIIGADGQAQSKSLEFSNPALSFTFKHQGFDSQPIWLFLENPEIAFEELPNGLLTHAPPPPFKLVSIDPVFFSGISVAYDPGFPIIILGVILILSGLVLYLSSVSKLSHGSHPL